jgi:hypothetical protein
LELLSVNADQHWQASSVSLASYFEKQNNFAETSLWLAKGGQKEAFLEDLNAALKDFEKNIESIEWWYSLGYGMYWHFSGTDFFKDKKNDQAVIFGEKLLDFYCSCVEMQQKSIFTFLLFWNQTVGVKEPAKMIAQMVWKDRALHPVLRLEKYAPRRSTRLSKRSKK